MSAALHVLPIPCLQDIPDMLRDLAADIEKGDYGDVQELALVLYGDSLRVFGFGKADGVGAHYLLACGQRKIENPML